MERSSAIGLLENENVLPTCGGCKNLLVLPSMLLYIMRTMKKLTTLLSVLALSTAAVAGPVAKTPVTQQEAARLAVTQQQSQQVLHVQAGEWADDYGVCTIAAIVGVAALAVGIVALAND